MSVNLSSNKREIVKESEVELSVPEGGRCLPEIMCLALIFLFWPYISYLNSDFDVLISKVGLWFTQNPIYKTKSTEPNLY